MFRGGILNRTKLTFCPLGLRGKVYPSRFHRKFQRAFYFMKKSFVLYTDNWVTLKHLSNEQLGELMRMLFEYQIEGNTPEPSNPLFIAFGFIRSSMDRDLEKWNERAERARVNGSKGGRPKENQDGLQETQKTQSVNSKPKKPVNVSVSVSDSVNVNVNANANFKKWSEQDLIEAMTPYKDRYPKELLNAFFNYWTEPLANGKIRLTSQDAWDTGRRLVTWKKRDTDKQPKTSTITRASMGLKMQ